ncbi:hypothetical protein ACFYKX_23370 [Cytobacillus sp. FJAT-54145]|uniref:DUF3899 domain-containing protein n=1 Tax=Cytobacillus spartinae TaxID=3299023 RepID=A0ABW6KKW7_9BACI
MSQYMFILMVISIGVLVFSLGYTLAVARNQKALKGVLDSSIPEKVQEHAYIRNPIFLTYAIMVALVALIITFAAIAW